MPDPAGEAFMASTHYEHLGPSDQQLGLPQPPLELPPDPDAPRLDLPAPAELRIPPLDVTAAVNARRSVRRYTDQPLSLAELSYLLWCTQGVKENVDDYVTMRTVPSAGARHAFETYLLLNRVEGVEPGLYRFLAMEHQLQRCRAPADAAARVTHACFGQRMVFDSAVTFVWTAVPYRMAWRYGQRGYRYLHLDAGHVCQNLYLAAEPVACGVCAIAAFDDDLLNAVLGIDGKTQLALYVAALGKRR